MAASPTTTPNQTTISPRAPATDRHRTGGLRLGDHRLLHLEPDWSADPYPIPPFHQHARKLLLPAFTKTAVSRQEPATRALCHALIDTFEGWDVVDAAADYAQHIPMRVIASMLGFPPQDGPRSASSSRRARGHQPPPEERIERMEKLFDYLLAQVHDHLEHPREDLTSYLIKAEIFGQKLQRTTSLARWPCC